MNFDEKELAWITGVLIVVAVLAVLAAAAAVSF